MQKSDLIAQLKKELPPAWDRTKTTKLTGGIVHHRTLANLMSQGKGPQGTFRAGHKKVIVSRDLFLDWLSERIDVNDR